MHPIVKTLSNLPDSCFSKEENLKSLRCLDELGELLKRLDLVA